MFLSWPESDQDKALAWMFDREQVCSGCGTRADEHVDEQGMPLDPSPFVVANVRCFGCEALEEARDAISKAAERNEDAGRGLKTYLRPYDPQRDADDEDGPADG